MLVSHKVQYGLRAVFELALRNSRTPAKITEIADVQGIPPRFLENILSELKHGGFVESRRGKNGGYLISRKPAGLTVGEIIRFMQGPVKVVGKDSNTGKNARGDVAFNGLWENIATAITEVYDKTTFVELIEIEKSRVENYTPDYAI